MKTVLRSLLFLIPALLPGLVTPGIDPLSIVNGTGLNGKNASSGLAWASTAKKTSASTAPGGWEARLSDHDNAPIKLIAVDKTSQQLFFFERQSPMRLAAEFPCTTGQSVGDKFVTGDLRTPEGVYFVVRHITSGLNYTLYGNEAYPLNYPNPVDRIRKKTGYGIWIHGKGVPLSPRDTQGCVGMNNGDIAVLGQKINIGQPVAMAASIERQPEMSGDKAAVIARLESNVQAWARAWSDRSASMFDFYNAEAYTLAHGQSFKNFRAQKESLFKRLDWIDTKVSDIQILEGPGYWVTWFNQDYKASNLSTSGTRRLYWQADRQGELRIVGMEWVPGLSSPVLLASNAKTAVDLPPATPAETLPAAKSTEQKNIELAAPAATSAATPAADPEKAAATKTVEPKSTELALLTPPASNSTQKAEAKVRFSSFDAMQLVGEWREAWQNGNLRAYAAFYAAEARQSGKHLNEFIDQKRRIWSKAKPALIELENVNVRETENGFDVEMIQTYRDVSGYADNGVKSLTLEIREGKTGPHLLIVREDWVSLPD
ncbi:MAG: L,D-transpeptidase family protein [Deltaproteobacteria bacterium]|nr:L,D-transpeptidase family protein [Deltaproteobacteria bacterium]